MEPSDNFSRLLAEVILKNEIIIEQISDQKKIHVRITFQSTLGESDGDDGRVASVRQWESYKSTLAKNIGNFLV